MQVDLLYGKTTALLLLWQISTNLKSVELEDIELIEAVAKDCMDFYGYGRMTLASSNITDKMIESAKESSKLSECKAWINLMKLASQNYQLRRFRSDYLSMIEGRLADTQSEFQGQHSVLSH